LGKAIENGNPGEVQKAVQDLAGKCGSSDPDAKANREKLKQALQEGSKPGDRGPDPVLKAKEEVTKALENGRNLPRALSDLAREVKNAGQGVEGRAQKDPFLKFTAENRQVGFNRFSLGDPIESTGDGQTPFGTGANGDTKSSKVEQINGFLQKQRIPFQYRQAVQRYFTEEE
jgi:hypothetical protein